MSDTPKTDRHCEEMLGVYDGWCKADFARQLERDLAAANEQIAALNDDLSHRDSLIVDLREKIDALKAEVADAHEGREKWLGRHSEMCDAYDALKADHENLHDAWRKSRDTIIALKAENEALRELLLECLPSGYASLDARIRAALERNPTTPTEDNA